MCKRLGFVDARPRLVLRTTEIPFVPVRVSLPPPLCFLSHINWRKAIRHRTHTISTKILCTYNTAYVAIRQDTQWDENTHTPTHPRSPPPPRRLCLIFPPHANDAFTSPSRSSRVHRPAPPPATEVIAAVPAASPKQDLPGNRLPRLGGGAPRRRRRRPSRQ